MLGQRTVLCIQDGTDLNYNGLVHCEGLGVIGNNQTGAASCGLHLHSTLVVTTDGLPLGVLNAKWEARERKKAEEKKVSARNKPVEEKKTFCWIESLPAKRPGQRDAGDASSLREADREADFFELFSEPRHHQVDLLVLAKHDRCIEADSKLFDTLRQDSVRGTLSIRIPRQSERAKKSKQKARPKRDERTVQVTLRTREIELLPPSYWKDRSPLKLSVIHLLEETPPAGETPLEWFLLTTIQVTNNRSAEQSIRWYRLRWRIEDWHRVLKSGCGAEELAHRTGERLKRGIAIKLVIAWRIMLMTLLGRVCPGLPADMLFSDVELQVLTAHAVKKS
ncbi:MAG: IS4 family transposase [Methylococcales bacterium]